MADNIGGLTDKQMRFVEEYLVDLNATQAAIRAGYSEKAANREGCRLLSKVDIREAINILQNQRSARVQITQDEVIADLKVLRDISMGRIKANVSMKSTDDEGNTHYSDAAIFQFDAAAANKTLELLGKHLGMFKEKIDVSVGVDEDILERMAQLECQNRMQSQKLKEKLEQRYGQAGKGKDE